MPPKQSGVSKPRPKAAGASSSSSRAAAQAKRPAAAAMQKSATTTGFSDISDVDPFADSAEEDEHRGTGQRKAQQQKQKQKQTSSKRGRQADIDMEEDDEEGRREHEDGDDDEQQEEEDEEEDGEDAPAQIPPDLLTRLLHEFFERDGTRISRDANAAVARYMDVFVRETIARTAVEKESGFLEVEDLEKVAPQLLLDL